MNNTEEYSKESFLKHFLKDFRNNNNINKEHSEIINTKNVKKVLEVIYRDIYKAYASTNSADYQKKIRSDILDLREERKREKKPDIFDSTFFPISVRDYIKKNAKYQLNYTIAENNINIHFTLFSENELNYLDNYTDQVHIMLLWLSICREYASKSCANKIDIYIYPTPLNKKLPKSTIDILSPEQVNTAYTYHCPKDGEIIIYRNEEWFKVFLHESFHTYGLDFANVPLNHTNIVTTTLRRLFPIDSEFNAAEAYTETWARIMNCAIRIFCSLKNKKDDARFYEYMESSLELERAFSVFQCNKILKFMGMEYNDLYEESEKSASLRRNLYKEKTNVFAYYILTSIFMNDVGEFLNWCYTHNSALLQFNNRSLKAFAEYIEKEYKNDSLNECLQQMNALYIKTTKKTRTQMNQLLLETTRMTLIG